MSDHRLAPSLASYSRDVSGALMADVLTTALQSRGRASRSDVARHLQVKQSSVSKAVKLLLERGLLVEGEPERAAQGRPWTPLEPGNACRLIGLCLTDVEHPRATIVQSKIFGVITTLDGDHVGQPAHAAIDVPLDGSPMERAIAIASQAADFVKAHLLPRLRDGEIVAGVGMTLGGQITDGVVIRSHNLGWDLHDPVPLQQHLRERLPEGIVVVVDNESSALADQLHWFGQWDEWFPGRHRLDNFLAVLVTPDGVGAGFYLEGRRYSAKTGITAELGHVTYRRAITTSGAQPDRNDSRTSPGQPGDRGEGPRLCRCGKSGCVEAYATPNRMLDEVRKLEGIRKRDLAEAAQSERSDILEVFHEGGAALGAGIAAAINMVGPEAIVIYAPEELADYWKPEEHSSDLASPSSSAGREYWIALRAALAAETFPGGADAPTAVVPLLASFGEDLAGAAATRALDALVARLRTPSGS
jgi:predicted NBD/HSP70 family sugar kinase